MVRLRMLEIFSIFGNPPGIQLSIKQYPECNRNWSKSQVCDHITRRQLHNTPQVQQTLQTQLQHQRISAFNSQLHNCNYFKAVISSVNSCANAAISIYRIIFSGNKPKSFIECQRILNSNHAMQTGQKYFWISLYPTKTGDNCSTIWDNYIKQLKRP